MSTKKIFLDYCSTNYWENTLEKYMYSEQFDDHVYHHY
jgi:hypothetical protein